MFLGVEAVGQIGADLGLQIFEISLVELGRRDFALGLSGFGLQFIDSGADFLDFDVGELDGVNHRLFFHFLGAGFDHHDAFGGADDHDVQETLVHLGVGWINDELAVDQADAHGADGAEERNVGDSEGGGSAVDAQDVGIVLGVGGEDQRDHLGFALKTFGEKWADGAIDLAAGESFALAHAAFALDEAAGNSAAGVGVFAVVNREREEVDAFAGIGIGGGRGQHNVIGHSHHDRAVGLLGQLSGFERDSFAAGEFNRNFLFH